MVVEDTNLVSFKSVTRKVLLTVVVIARSGVLGNDIVGQASRLEQGVFANAAGNYSPRHGDNTHQGWNT